MRTLPLRRWSAVFIALVAAASAARAARNETWLRVSTPELEVITSLPAKEATAWASEFAQYVAALRQFFGNTRVKLPALTVVIFGRERDFEEFYPLMGPGGKPQPLDGFFSRHESWAVVGMAGRLSEEGRRTIFHEGVHWFLSTMPTRNAVWMEEGLAEVFSTFRAEKDRAEWGRAIENHVGLLRYEHPLPLEKLLYTAQSDLFGEDLTHTGIVYAESWAFVHFVLFGKHQIPRRAIAEFSDLTSNGTPVDAAFECAFGKSYKEMDRLLNEYLSGGQYFVAKRSLAEVAPPVAQPASRLEVENALGRLAFAGHRGPQAIARGRAAITAAPEDPRGHELLGLALHESGDTQGAMAEFERAVERGSKDFQPYFELAASAQNAAVNDGGELSPAGARKIANRYERAINFYPRYQAAYENLAGVISVAEPWGEEDRRFFELGSKLFPGSAMTRIGLAVLQRRGGDHDGARAQLDQVLTAKSGLSLEGSQFAHRLDVAWEQEDIGKRIDELASAGKFAEAIAYLDQRLEQGVDQSVRMRLRPVRENLAIAQLSLEVKEAFANSEWARARGALTKLMNASSAPPLVKDQARRSLADLDRRRLGLEQPPTK